MQVVITNLISNGRMLVCDMTQTETENGFLWIVNVAILLDFGFFAGIINDEHICFLFVHLT